jgi:hypothetical protein
MRFRSLTFLHAALLFAIGLGYRAIFLPQGFNLSDEAWLPALARRVDRGQIPYRDFYYALPPFTVYKEAALMRVLGDHYSFLASRWMFAVEVSLASVFAYLVIRRFATAQRALWVSLPTVFFTTILYYYSNFNEDAVFLFVGSLAILVWAGERRPLLVLAGVACGLAVLAKPTYAPLPFVVCAAALLRPLLIAPEPGAEVGAPRGWPWFAAGAAGVIVAMLGLLTAAGQVGAFIYQSFFLLRQAHQVSLGFLLLQDWPYWLVGGQRVAPFAIVLGLALVLAPFGRSRLLASMAMLALLALLAIVLVPARHPSTQGIPTFDQMELLASALGLLLALNVVALAVSAAAWSRWWWARPFAQRLRTEIFPPQLPLIALSVQLLHDYSLTGMRFSYVGTFLSIPTALLFLFGLGRAGLRFGGHRWGAAVVGAWLAMAGPLVLFGSPYLDGPRTELAAGFREPALAGLRTLPANARHVDATVAAVDRYSRPGQAAFVFPDGQGYYVLTGRRNPTRIDWYDVWATTPSMSNDAVSALAADPPAVVLVQRYNESDFNRVGPPLDFESEPKWRPIYDWIIANYQMTTSVGDVDVYLPR